MTEFAFYYLPADAVPYSDPTTPGLVYQPDHAGDAESRLLVQFEKAEKLHALVRALVKPFQSLELDAFAVRDAFDVAVATGDQLDILGNLVGEARQSKIDAAYRAYVLARILANDSNGTPTTLYAVARALLGETVTLQISPLYPAGYDFLIITAGALVFPWDVDEYEVSSDLVAKALADALMLATSAGVGFTVYYQYSAYAFEFASGDVEETDALRGFADDDELDPGGDFIGAEDRT
jgi:Protein of unknown function (DUF2612)